MSEQRKRQIIRKEKIEVVKVTEHETRGGK